MPTNTTKEVIRALNEANNSLSARLEALHTILTNAQFACAQTLHDLTLKMHELDKAAVEAGELAASSREEGE